MKAQELAESNLNGVPRGRAGSSEAGRAAAPAWRSGILGRIFGRRRRYFLDRRTQLRPVLMTTGFAALFLAFVDVMLYLARVRSSEMMLASSPDLAPLIRYQDRTEMLLLVLGSLVLLGVVLLVSILETHRTAGAAHNVTRRLAAIRDGRHDVRVVLRRGDNLGEIAGAINEVSQALVAGAWDEIQALEELAVDVEGLEGSPEVHALAHRLRRMADERRARIER